VGTKVVGEKHLSAFPDGFTESRVSKDTGWRAAGLVLAGINPAARLDCAIRKAGLSRISGTCAGRVVAAAELFFSRGRSAIGTASNKLFYDRIAAKFAEGVGEFLQIAHACRLPDPLNAKVVCDKGPAPVFLQALGEHLRKIKDHRGTSLSEKVSSQRALSNNLIQMADMVLGAIVHPNHGHTVIVQKKKWVELEWP
jgi:hypothetical protein